MTEVFFKNDRGMREYYRPNTLYIDTQDFTECVFTTDLSNTRKCVFAQRQTVAATAIGRLTD